MSPNRYLSRREQSDYLERVWGIQRAPTTLAKYATTGGGPKYCLVGAHAKSTAQWLDEYALSLITAPKTSTSEAT